MAGMQLKITLQDSRPPIWRRVLVNSGITFWDLHGIIQDLFGWEDEHLHSFRPFYKGAKEKRVYFEVPRESDRIGFITPGAIRGANYDEHKEKLADWFDKKRNTYLYTYDFGDNWQHEIIFEKFVDVPRFKLAKYLGGERRGLEEDSRPDGLLDCESIILAFTSQNDWWKEIIEIYGKSRANRILSIAQKEAGRPAPSQIKFSDPGERYKIAEAMGMFD